MRTQKRMRVQKMKRSSCWLFYFVHDVSVERTSFPIASRNELVNLRTSANQVLIILGLFFRRGKCCVDAAALAAQTQLVALLVKILVAFVRPPALEVGCLALLGHLLKVDIVASIPGGAVGASIALVAHLSLSRSFAL